MKRSDFGPSPKERTWSLINFSDSRDSGTSRLRVSVGVGVGAASVGEALGNAFAVEEALSVTVGGGKALGVGVKPINF